MSHSIIHSPQGRRLKLGLNIQDKEFIFADDLAWDKQTSQTCIEQAEDIKIQTHFSKLKTSLFTALVFRTCGRLSAHLITASELGRTTGEEEEESTNAQQFPNRRLDGLPLIIPGAMQNILTHFPKLVERSEINLSFEGSLLPTGSAPDGLEVTTWILGIL